MRGPVRGEPRLSAWPAACLRRSLAMFCGAAVFLGVLNAAPVAAQTHRTVWDGVFTAEQAARGKAIYATTCAACHGADLGGVNHPSLKGEVFLSHWMEGGLDALFARVKSMPKFWPRIAAANRLRRYLLAKIFSRGTGLLIWTASLDQPASAVLLTASL